MGGLIVIENHRCKKCVVQFKYVGSSLAHKAYFQIRFLGWYNKYYWHL